MSGESVCREGSNQPDGMVSIRKGAVVLEIAGTEVRQVGDGQTIGEDPHPGSGTDAGTREKNGWTTCDPLQLHNTIRVPHMRTKSNNERLKSSP